MFLKLRQYRQVSLRKKRNEKLCQKYFRPYKVIARIEKVDYKLELPPLTTISCISCVSIKEDGWRTTGYTLVDS